MTAYTPEPVPQTAGSAELQEYLMRELSRIGAALERADTITLPNTDITPTRPQEGDIIYADGTNFNPGGGEGFYGYRNGAWVKLDNVGGDDSTFARLRLTATDDAALASTLHAFQVGPSAANNIIMDDNEIMARNNGAVTTLFLNANGGLVHVGAGLQFPATQVASADPNALDDYEEGTWTPTWVPSAGAFGAHSYSSRQGNYTKVGRLVNVYYQIHLSAYVVGSASGTVTIQGLPFSQPTGGLIGAPFWANAFATQQPWPVALMSSGAINVYNGASQVSGPTAAYPVANFSNNAQVYGSGVYPAS